MWSLGNKEMHRAKERGVEKGEWLTAIPRDGWAEIWGQGSWRQLLVPWHSPL